MAEKDQNVGTSILTYLEAPVRKSIEDLYKKMDVSDEYEVMFYNFNNERMSFEKFLMVTEFLTQRQKLFKTKYSIETHTLLDVIHSKPNESHRLSIDNLPVINKYIRMLHMRKNHIIYNILTMTKTDNGKQNKIDKTDGEHISVIKKTKTKEDIVDVDDFNIRFRLSNEEKFGNEEIKKMQNLKPADDDDIIFRYKQRLSLILLDDEYVTIRIDLTNVKMSKSLNKLENNIPIYELEIDISPKKVMPAKNRVTYLQMMYDEIDILTKILQQSNFIISKKVSSEVINFYRTTLGVSTDSMSLEGRNPESLEIQHVTDILPNRFAVSDKADGERYFLIIYENKVFLISNNLITKYTGIVLPDKLSKYNGTVLDGEYIFLSKYNRHLFMAFDCLKKGIEDIRPIPSFFERLTHADEIIDNCFVLDKQAGFKHKQYDGPADSKQSLDYYEEQMMNFIGNINKDIQHEKKYLLARRKYFIPVVGSKDNEIFKYALKMWDTFLYNKNVHLPYVLDGLVFHPLDQKYVSRKLSKYVEYKWKPPQKNSLDFFIQFEKDPETGKILTVFDNSLEDKLTDKPYKICYLYVGKIIKNREVPTLFQQDQQKYIAYLFLKDGEVRDQTGRIIQDNTVVEFYYDTSPDIENKTRWIPIRTRYDKTESVMRYKRKYGNFHEVADKVWRSIINPVIMNDFDKLAKDDIFKKHMDFLRGRIDHSIIMSEAKSNVYYQIQTNLAKPMREFHNWIKSCMIYTLCNKMYTHDRKLSVLDIACGKGGDIMKFYHAEISFYVGVDKFSEGIYGALDGALSRYKKFSRAFPNFPKMQFIVADGGALLDYDEQVKVYGTINDEMKQAMHKFFSIDPKKRTTFDRINCQFAFHYFLENQTIWNNFCENLNMYLKPGGYFLFTTFDAKRIVELFKTTDNYAEYYTDRKGEKRIFINIIKKFSDDVLKTFDTKPLGIGNAIDFHNAMFFGEDEIRTEYLVDKRFIEGELLSKCGLELVDTDLFENQYELHRDFLTKAAKSDRQFKDKSDKAYKTREFLKKVAVFYDQTNEMNRVSFKFSRLNRYYIFRKKEDISKPSPETAKKPVKKNSRTKSKQKGGAINTILSSKNIIVKKPNNPSEHTFMESIQDILQVNKIIPKQLSTDDFCRDLKIKMIADGKINKTIINKIIPNIQIEHNIDGKKDIVIDGVNLMLVENDCNGITTDLIGDLKNDCPVIVLFTEDNHYYPVYEKIGGDTEVNGIFDANHELIQKLFNES